MSLHRKARPKRQLGKPRPKVVGSCPENGKVSYGSRKDALRFASRTGRFHKNGRAIPYRCDCGDWHLTSRKGR